MSAWVASTFGTRNSSSPSKRKSGHVIKKEASPIDVDMLSSGNKGSPIYIESDSTTSDEEVDAQMDNVTPATDDHVGGNGGRGETSVDKGTDQEDADLMNVEEAAEEDVDVKDERYSSPLEYVDPPAVDKVPLFARSTSDSSDLERSEEPRAEGDTARNQSTHTPVQSAMERPPVEPAAQVAALEAASREPTKELSAEPSDSEHAEERSFTESEVPNDTTRESHHDDPSISRSPSPVPPSPSQKSMDPASSTHNTSSPDAKAFESSSSPSPTPDPKMAPFLDLVRPRPKPKMKLPPATQPPPDAKKRSFPFSNTPTARSQSPKPAPKRKALAHIPASQPAISATAPVRASAGSSTAVSLRALTIDSEDSGTENPKHKRAKVDDGAVDAFKVPASQSKPFRRPAKHPDHWHTDGSVILSFQNTAFRLHRSRLSQQSPLLSELFHGEKTVVNGGNDDLKVKAWREGNMDAKPLFVVEGVSPEDFDKMLKAADNAIQFVFQPPSFTELSSILRASLMLNFTSLSTFSTHALTSMWPSTLPSYRVSIGGQRDHAEETIVLARTCALPSLLKRAFYELLRAPGLGQQLDDEFMFAGNDDAWARRKIGRTDLVRLIRTREELASQWARGAALPPDSRDFLCPLASADVLQANPELVESSQRCKEARQSAVDHWRDLVLNSDLYVEYMNDPIEGLERLSELKWEDKGFCKGCVDSWRASWGRQREKVWDNLDLWLELPQNDEEGRPVENEA